MELRERFRQAMAFASGACIAVAAFVLLFWTAAWFMPVFLRLNESQWAPLFPGLFFLFLSVTVPLRWRIRSRDRFARGPRL